MEPIQSIDSLPENEFSLVFGEPATSHPGPVVSLFLRCAPRPKAIDNPTTKQKVTAKSPKKIKKAKANESSAILFLPQIPQLILLQKANTFLPKEKEEILFHVEACEAKIVAEGWKRYGEHLAEEAALQRSHDIKKRKRQDLKDSQDKRFLYEQEDIKKQDARRGIYTNHESLLQNSEKILLRQIFLSFVKLQ